jgi:hypothetical protein
MATWKKVTVSGSDISQLNNDSGFLVSGDSGVILSGSFTGSFQGDGSNLLNVVLSNDLTDGNGINDFTYNGSGAAAVSVQVSGSTLEVGANGVRVKDLGIDTAQLAANAVTTNKITDGNVTNAKLANSGSTIGSTDVVLGTTVNTIAGLTLTGAVGSGSFSGSFAGDGSSLTGVSASVLLGTLTDGNGIADFTFNGSSNASVVVEVSGSTLEVGANGVRVKDLGIDTAQLAANAVTNAKLANSGSTIGSTPVVLGTTVNTIAGLTLTGAVASGSFSGSFQGDGSGLSGIASTLNVSGSTGNGSVDLLTQTFTVAGTANEVETSMAGQTLTVGLPSDVTISQDLTVTRNLTVQGTASFQHETNLDVADRFIRLASGSSAGGDGGIVIQQDSPANGEAFAFDVATTRWGVTGSFDASTNTIAPDAFMAAVVIGAGTDPSAAPARYQAKGNIFVGTDGEAYIYT